MHGTETCKHREKHSCMYAFLKKRKGHFTVRLGQQELYTVMCHSNYSKYTVCTGWLLGATATHKSIWHCWIMRTEWTDYLFRSPGQLSICSSRGMPHCWIRVFFPPIKLWEVKVRQESHGGPICLFKQWPSFIRSLTKELQTAALAEMW